MEEKIGADLQLAEVKRENLWKAYEHAHAHASSVLVLTLQWKDLEEHFDATRVSLHKGLEEMVSREKRVGLKEKLLEDAEARVSKEIAVKEELLGSLQNRILECSNELKLKNEQLGMKEEQLGSLQNRIVECSNELKSKSEQLGMKEEELELVGTCLLKCSREVELKQTQLSIVEKSVKECCGELDLRQSQLNRVRSLLDEHSKELKLREDQVARVERLFEARSLELASKEGELEKVQQLLVQVGRNISLKEETLGEVQQQLASRCASLSLKDGELLQRSKEVASQTKQLEELAKEIASKKNALCDVLTLTKNKSTELGAIQKNIDLLEASVREYSEKLEGKRKLYEEIQRSIQECSRKSRLKNQEYELLRKSVEEECAELRSRQRKYELFRKSLEKSCHGLKLKEQEYELNKRSLDKLVVELRSKENEYESSKKSLDKLCTELRSREKEYELSLELKSKEKEYEMKRKSLEEPHAESEGKENKLDSVVELLNSLSKEVEGKMEQLVSIEGKIKKYCEDVELREKEFKEILNSIVAQSELLKSKEKQLQSIQILIDNGDKELRQKKDEHDSIKKSISECSKELESKVKELNSVQKSLREHSDELDTKVREFLSAQKTVNESLEELKHKEIQLESIQKSVEERIKEAELKEKRLTTTNTSPSKNLQPRDLLLNNAINSHTSPELFASIDGQTLQLFINEHLSRHDLVRGAISAAFSGSLDPAMLVLDAVQGFYPHSSEGSRQFDSVIVKRSCILLLEQLMRISPQIKPQVKEDARMVAHQWKARMIVESNSLDVLAFLLLLATYGLASMFNPDELQSLTNMVAQHSRQVSELRQAFGFNEMAIERSIPCAKIKMEEGECVGVQDAIVSFSVDPQTSASTSLLSFLEDHSDVHDSMADKISNALKTALDPALVVLDMIKRSGHQEWENGNKNLKIMNRYILVLQHLMGVSAPITSYVKEEAEKLAIKWKANLRDGTGCSLEVLFFLHFLAVYGLISSFDGDEVFNLLLTVAHHSKAPDLGRVLGFSDKMNYFIESLIRRKQNLEAIAFIYEFQLGDKFSPILLMQKYMQNARTSINRSRRKGEQDLAVEKEEAALRAVAKCMSNYKVESKILSDLIEKRLMEIERQKEDEKTKGTTPSLSTFDAKDQAQQQSMDIAATSVELQNASKDHSQLKICNKVTNPSTGIKLQKKVVKLKKECTPSKGGQEHQSCSDAPAAKLHSEQKSLDNKTNTTASNDQSKRQAISNAAATTATEAKLQPKVVKKESSIPCTSLEQQRSNGAASSSVQLQQNGLSAPKHHKPATPAVGVKLGPVTMKRDFRSTFPSKNHANRERDNKRHKAYTTPTPRTSAMAPGTCLPVNSAWQPQQPRRYFNEGVGNYGLPPAQHHFRVEGGWPNRYPGMQFFCPY